ncbi:hypothetical protein Rumeso_00389 [Rubellimicrobium mesophilum DSM 19309]|uniref:DUF429 domain-containing protein n=1 Tax=Rubellimicrobium mesophilum DSM 19309 TaxID=442562 RepID=A0A017HUB9_9RHOB|nr:DUF429 domain-containing protein [Rubellimicrobium mesophilum]EYD78052.1 hypothetical protein Rumeso_00389 [Rubellimicrobium mesophilum DSM 19309]
MRVHGIDFTSAPSRRKPIRVAECRLDGGRLSFEGLEGIASLPGFEAFLATPGPWVAGFDLPFTQSRRFLDNIGWPRDWPAFADRLGGLTRAGFRAALEGYKAGRAPGDREHARGYEVGTGAVSPQKLYGVPVALMQFEAVPRLRRAGVHIPGLAEGDRSRVALEAYPGVAARALIGRVPYKSDVKARQTPERAAARRELLGCLTGAEGQRRFGLRVEAPGWLADDPTGDPLDALLCAVQAAWAHRLMEEEPERIAGLDLSEGWIADPDVLGRLRARQGD